MKWKDVQAALKKVAPAAASAIGGPVAGVVTQAVATALGADHTPSAVAQALANDPDAAVKLAGIEAEVERARLEDIQDARRAGRGHWMPPTLTLIYIGMIVGCLIALLAWDFPASNRDIIFTIIGAIIARFTQGGDYWLGSSRGSADKQASLAAVLRDKG